MFRVSFVKFHIKFMVFICNKETKCLSYLNVEIVSLVVGCVSRMISTINNEITEMPTATNQFCVSNWLLN